MLFLRYRREKEGHWIYRKFAASGDLPTQKTKIKKAGRSARTGHMTFMMDWTCTSITLQSIIIYAAHHRRRPSSLSLFLFNPWRALRVLTSSSPKRPRYMLIFFIISLSIVFFKEIFLLVNRAKRCCAEYGPRL